MDSKSSNSFQLFLLETLFVLAFMLWDKLVNLTLGVIKCCRIQHLSCLINIITKTLSRSFQLKLLFHHYKVLHVPYSNGIQIPDHSVIRQLLPIQIQWGSEIRPSLDFEFSKTGWVTNGLDFEWDLKSRSPTI